jgi:hypothetical protein
MCVRALGVLQVTKGMDVVHAIEKTKCKDTRPIVPIKIVNMEVK